MSQNKQSKKNKSLEKANADEATAIAQGIKQENQTKAQTKLIAQGIRKGVELYKSQQNKKLRDIDKRKKKDLKNKIKSHEEIDTDSDNGAINFSKLLPWGLLIISWIFFIIYNFFIDKIV